jgi:hypothetical protein
MVYACYRGHVAQIGISTENYSDGQAFDIRNDFRIVQFKATQAVHGIRERARSCRPGTVDAYQLTANTTRRRS